jgi:hypothetical protein
MTIAKPVHRRLDAGSLIMVPAATIVLFADAIVLAKSNGHRLVGAALLGWHRPDRSLLRHDHLGLFARARV